MNGGTVKKIEGDLWEGRWREDRRQFRRRFRTKGMAEDAIRAARDRDERRRNGIPEPIEPISYRELAERYLAQYDARSKRWFMDMLRPSVARFGSTSLLSLRPDEIAVWLAGLPHAASTNEKRLDVMRQVLKMGVEWVTCRGTLPARRPSRGQPPSQPMFVRSGHGTRCSPSPAFSAHIAQPQSSQRPPARAPKNGSHWNQRTYPRTLGRA